MKNLKKNALKWLVFIVLLMTTKFSFSQETKPLIKIESDTASMDVNIYLANLLGQTTQVNLQNEKGQGVFTETIYNKAAFAKRLDLKQLEEGKYTFYITREAEEVVQPIVVSKNGITVLREQYVVVKSPKIEVNDKAVTFQLAPTALAKKVTVTIIKDGQTIYETKEIVTSAVKKQYNLSSLAPDSYVFQLSVDGKSYYKNFDLN
ncbi:MAG: hypothetical protein HC912_00495 [Saprospiraceae bacterium]|nr:hypothetical protein [Saprospiraceae bacterium]